VVAVTNLDARNLDDVVVLQDVPGNGLTIHQGAIGASQIFQDVIVADRGDAGMRPADAFDGEAQVTVGQSTDGETGLVEESVVDHFAV